MDVEALWNEQVQQEPPKRLDDEVFEALGREPLRADDPQKISRVGCITYAEARRARRIEYVLSELARLVTEEHAAGRLGQPDPSCAVCRGEPIPARANCALHLAQAATQNALHLGILKPHLEEAAAGSGEVSA